MQFNKNKLGMLFIYMIAFAIYNIIAFSLVGQTTSNLWSSYAFTTAAFMIQVAVYFLVFRGNRELRDVFLGVPLILISAAYFFIQLIIGLIIIVIIDFDFMTANIIQTIFLLIYLFFAISALIGNDLIEQIDTRTKVKVLYIKSLENEVFNLIESGNDPSINKMLKNLSETIKYSDPMSHSSLAVIEQRISTNVSKLIEQIISMNFTAAQETCEGIEKLFVERNNKCKLLK